MNNIRWAKSFRKKEENIAIALRLSGKVKNFTGRAPAVIQVKIEDNLATVQLKWILTNLEKAFLCSCKDTALLGQMQKELFKAAGIHLNRAFSEVFNSEVKILEVNEDLTQEKLRFQVQVLDLVS